VQAGVCEEIEQRRRCLDLGGEALKKSLAKEMSKNIPRYAVLRHVESPLEKSFLIIEDKKEEVDLKMEAQNILSQGWEALKHAAEVVGNKTAALVESIVDNTSAVAETVGHKTSDMVEQIVDTTSHMAVQVAHSTSDIAHSTADIGQQIAAKTENLAHTISHATSEAAIEFGHQIRDKTGEVASFVEHKFEETLDKLHEIKDDASKLYVKTQEKVEQARRMISGEEQVALLNAMAVSALIADLDVSFYKQCCVNKRYGAKLLESMEMKWRVFHELDGFAMTNAKKEALLITNYFASKTVVENITCVPLKMVETVDPVVKQGYTAAQ